MRSEKSIIPNSPSSKNLIVVHSAQKSKNFTKFEKSSKIIANKPKPSQIDPRTLALPLLHPLTLISAYLLEEPSKNEKIYQNKKITFQSCKMRSTLNNSSIVFPQNG